MGHAATAFARRWRASGGLLFELGVLTRCRRDTKLSVVNTRTLGGDEISWAVGSVAGFRHLERGLGSQDAIEVRVGEGAWVAVVADGCGSATHSAVGARLGAQLFAERALAASQQRELQPAAIAAQVVEELGRGWLPQLGQHRLQQFLFTTLVAVVTPERVSVWARGDGVVGINSELIRLGPFAGNRPPYLFDCLLGLEAQPSPTFERTLPFGQLHRLVLATDGVLDLAPDELRQLTAAPWNNPDGLRRELFRRSNSRPVVEPKAGRVTYPGRVLADDTSVCVLRRQAVEAAP